MSDGPGCPPMQVTGDFTINNSLDVATFASVTQLTGKLTIAASSLGDISFPCLETAGGVQASVTTLALPNLTALTGGQAYPGDLVLDATTLTAPRLSAVAGTVTVDVAQLDLASLQSVGGDFTIWCSPPALTTLSGLGKLRSVGGNVLITGDTHGGCTNLAGLEMLTTVGGTLRLAEVDLVDLAALSNLTSVDSLDVRGVAMTATLHGLEGVTALPGKLEIGIHNDLTGLDNLTSVGGDVHIDQVASLDGLGKLQTIGGNGQFVSATTSGLAHLASVQGNLFFDANDVSLPALTNVGTDFQVDNATRLVAPLLKTVTGVLWINNDPMLPQCYADALVAQLSPPPAAVEEYGLDGSGTCP